MADSKTTHLELIKQDLASPPDGEKEHLNLDKLDSEVWARGKTFNGTPVGNDGGFHVDSIPLADNLSTSAGQESEDTYLIRTTGGEASISDNSDAWLMQINGAYVHTGHEDPIVDMQLYPAARDPSEEELDADINKETFMSYVTVAGITTLSYNGSSWSADISNYGISIISGTPKNGDVITVSYTLEVPGTITMSNPQKFTSTGWNLYDHTVQRARVLKYSTTPGYRFMISGSYTVLEWAATETGSRTTISPVNNSFDIPGDGYLFVTGGNNTDTQIWMTWSDWDTVEKANKGVYEGYVEYHVDLADFLALYFPYGLMSVGEVYDDINLNTGYATQKIDRYAISYLDEIKQLGRPYIYDENYVYVEREQYLSIKVELPNPSGDPIEITGGYIANDHGMEIWSGGTVPMLTHTVYGANLKNKIERDVLTISQQSLEPEQQQQVRSNIGAIDKNMILMSNDMTYVILTQDVAINSSYTVPADGIYNLRTVGVSGNMASWYIDSTRKNPIAGNSSSYALVTLVPLKKGTIIYTRNLSNATYRVNGYYPI